MNLARASAIEIRDLVNRRGASAEELMGVAAGRIDAVDERVGAFLTRCFEQAREDARAVDRRIAGGETLPLAGVPLAVKDVLCTRGVATTCGSRILQGFQPPYDATSVERLRDAGAVMLGKSNMDEFAMGSSNENSAHGVVRNPWSLDRVPGGSSGGSAAAVAAEMVPMAVGTDTGGSIRQPAAFCGVVGLKPTYGRISRFGLIAFASSLDQIGPMSRTVADCAAALGVLAGHDERDMTSARVAVPDYEKALADGVRGMRVGVPKEYFGPGLAADVGASVNAALEQLGSLGAILQDISLPHTEYAIPTYYILANAEASSNLARYDGVRYGKRRGRGGDLQAMYRSTRGGGFGPEVKRRIMLGTYALSAGYYDAYYLKASKVRRLIRGDFDEAFKEIDLIACPTAPETAFPLGAKVDDPLSMYLSDLYTATANLAGVPALSLPCGVSGEGLPIGLQLMARHFDESSLLRAAHALEETLGFREQRARRPPLPAGD